MAPRILIFSIAMGADYSFELILNETCAPQFNGHNKSFLANVPYVLRNKKIAPQVKSIYSKSAAKFCIGKYLQTGIYGVHGNFSRLAGPVLHTVQSGKNALSSFSSAHTVLAQSFKLQTDGAIGPIFAIQVKNIIFISLALNGKNKRNFY